MATQDQRISALETRQAVQEVEFRFHRETMARFEAKLDTAIGRLDEHSDEPPLPAMLTNPGVRTLGLDNPQTNPTIEPPPSWARWLFSREAALMIAPWILTITSIIYAGAQGDADVKQLVKEAAEIRCGVGTRLVAGVCVVDTAP